MGAYVSTYIYGNEAFGGYFSVDGSATVPVRHDMTYQLDPGPHHIEFFSTSNAQRNAGKLQATIYANTSSSGALVDALERREAMKNLGDSWTIDVFVEDGQMLALHIRSQGKSLVGSPSYVVEDLSEEQCEALEEMFAELEAEREAERKRPKRSRKKIVWGTILTILGALCCIMYLQENPIVEIAPETVAPPAVFAVVALIGLLLFLNGIKKKPRG